MAGVGIDIVQGSTATATVAPTDAISGLTVTPGDKQLTLSWNANAHAQHGYGVSYKLSSAGNFGTITRVGSDRTGTTSYIITGLTKGQECA